MLNELHLKQQVGNLKSKMELELIKKLSDLANEYNIALEKLIADTDKFDKNWTNLRKAKFSQKTLLKDMAVLRSFADQMELLIGKDFIAFPTYQDILYSVKY